MISRQVCPQSDPSAIEELTKAASATAREKFLTLETELLEAFTSVGQKEQYMRLADMREEISTLETEAIVQQLHCPSCPNKGSQKSCPE